MRVSAYPIASLARELEVEEAVIERLVEQGEVHLTMQRYRSGAPTGTYAFSIAEAAIVRHVVKFGVSVEEARAELARLLPRLAEREQQREAEALDDEIARERSQGGREQQKAELLDRAILRATRICETCQQPVLWARSSREGRRVPVDVDLCPGEGPRPRRYRLTATGRGALVALLEQGSAEGRRDHRETCGSFLSGRAE